MSVQIDAILESVLDAAITLGRAEAGWIVAAGTEELPRAACVRGSALGAAVGSEIGADTGLSWFVIGTAQPVSLSNAEADHRFATGFASAVRNALCVPCQAGGETLGALELVNHRDGSFTLEDIEVVSLVAQVAGAALLARDGSTVPSPAELSGSLAALAAADATRYAHAAALIETVLNNA